MFWCLCFSPGDHLTSQQGPPPLPPAPPPHKQHPSITSLSRSSLANQRSPSPPPTAGLAADLQSTAECVQLQDSWVLGSNVALESRWVTRSDLHQSWEIQAQVLLSSQFHWVRKQNDVKQMRGGQAAVQNVHFNLSSVSVSCCNFWSVLPNGLYTFYIGKSSKETGAVLLYFGSLESAVCWIWPVSCVSETSGVCSYSENSQG